MYKKIALSVLFLTLFVWIYFSGILNYISLDSVKANRDFLVIFTQDHYWLVVAIFILIYTLLILFCFPIGWIMTLVGGYLFGLWTVIYVNIAIAIGCTSVFLLVRYVIGDWVQKKFAKRLVKFNKGLEKNKISYLLTLRLMPIFPFFLVNLLAGVTKIKLWDFVWTTVIGTIFGTYVYALAGQKLASINTVMDIFSSEIILAFVCLNIVSFLPATISYFRRKQIQ
jgi:uncharacterized membrane protein YdjX (TVP38/TMEM64 family)